MGRLALLVLLFALAWGGENAGPATPMRWAAGPCTLADAIGRLAVSGNTVWLATGIDDRQARSLPAVDGVWWDGVIALCQAFALRPDAGDPSDDRLEQQIASIPIGHGGLVLSAGPLPGVQIQGSLLIAAEAASSQSLSVWLRVEPRLARGTLAAAGIDMLEMVPRVELEPSGTSNGTTWQSDKPIASNARLIANLHIAGFSSYTSTTALTAGKQVDFAVLGQPVKAMLITDPMLDTWEGATVPERRPLLAVIGPQDLMQRAVLRLRQGGSELPTRGSTSRGAGDGRMLQMRFLRSLPEGAIDLTLEGRQSQTPDKFSLSVPVPRAPAVAVAKPSDAPTQVRWDAGSEPLSVWLARLSATGNPVLPEVGVDTRSVVSLPALQGSFWDGVLALCRASGLRPAMPAIGELGGGAVRLVRGTCATSTACGPLLLEATVVASETAAVTLAIRGLLEPRLVVESFGTPEFRWASWAREDDDTVHPIASAPSEHEQAWPLVSFNLLRPGVARIRLDGMIGLPRVLVERISVTLDPEKPVEHLVRNRLVEITALTSPRAIGGNLVGPGILLRGLVGCDNVDFSVVASDGQPAENGSCMRVSGRMSAGPFLSRLRAPPQPGLQADFSAKVDQPDLVLPISLQVVLPDRR